MANQIFFNPLNANLRATNVQDAIIEASELLLGALEPHQARYHSDGVLNRSNVYENIYKIKQNVSVSYASYNPNTDIITSKIILSVPEEIDNLEVGDFVLLNDLNERYKIFDIEKLSSKIISVKVFGNIKSSSLSLSTADFEKDSLSKTSVGSFYPMSLNDPNLTSNNIIKFVNSDSTYIISDYIMYSKINSSSQKFLVEVDGVDYEINCANLSSTKQSIDIIFDKMSESISENNIPLTIFRYNDNFGSRIGISYDHPNDTSSISYIMIKD